MNNFESFFNENTIISYLCKLRAKVAKSRNKKHLIHLLTDSEKYNYHINDIKKYSDYEDQFLRDLNKLFPSRKKWVGLGKNSRINKRTGFPISTFDRNYYTLKKTIKSFKKRNPSEPFLIAQDEFISDIKESILSPQYKITTPIIYPKLKEIKNGKYICRPISLFSLKDRVILSLTNKFLTILFDKYFEESSYAFRAKKNSDETRTLSHHDCIKSLKELLKLKKSNELFVAECDMEKFYDTVNHEIIKILFEQLIEKAKIDNPNIGLARPMFIFNEFLASYAFNKNVLPLNNNTDYWKKNRMPGGQFDWVESKLYERKYYHSIESERIGVPQGGALSGLIANIVLDFADKEIKDLDVFYIRFCDDMLIIDPELTKCQNAKETYLNSLESLYLVPHKFCNNSELFTNRTKRKSFSPTSLKPFWKKKSKGPYKWGSIEGGGFPWIGFVGYELHYNGDIRVRKKSLEKELKKQKEIIAQITKAIKEGRRKSVRTVSESAIHRLVGMSVGRVTIKNFDKIENEFCWKNGFKELFINKYSVHQMKMLD